MVGGEFRGQYGGEVLAIVAEWGQEARITEKCNLGHGVISQF